MSVKA